MTDLRQDIQTLIGPDDEWPEGVREYMRSRSRLLLQRREARDAIDVTFNARIEVAVAVPDAALMELAGMVKRGTCGECAANTGLCSIRAGYASTYHAHLPLFFGCTLFEPHPTKEAKGHE